MVKPQGGSKASKKPQPPILSHEFIIQNHGDIMSCVVMVFIVGLMFPLTHSLSSLFIAPQYNGTYTVAVEQGQEREVHGYLSGILDLPAIFFYSVCWIVVHAVVQEYGLDKISKKTHLSKVSTFKFGESFHQMFFTVYSIAHAFYIVSERLEDFSEVKSVWLGYPTEHRVMSAAYKLYFIFQISYWIHQFPEFYLQKLKRDEIRQKSVQAILHIAFISIAYFFNFTRVGLALITLEYITQLIFHIARFAHFVGRKGLSDPAFKLFNGSFVLVRLGSIIIAVMTFWYGLRQAESPFVDISAGNFNTAVIRLNVLLAVVLLQLFLLYSFVVFHMGRFRESNAKKEKKKSAAAAAAVPKKEKKRQDSESDSKKKN
ncbi:Translocating chain-associated membrane protein [Caenorhabditis elegans]|uniref:Translocating chain-associated membrane protein n=1 Tax=Caenorhabditis elegans TaxID=6239 RepID=Q9U3P5_CAEEL|nr:Translocating chain-associated membrane protein [Caenorhabditis elegans]CAA18770.1 Translocating chain-associated membrane protein [Caenorhabditis elegans]|eukprot:NP_501869.1 Translocating chain-associated membrane protein [Caenorhabditis elegans]